MRNYASTLCITFVFATAAAVAVTTSCAQPVINCTSAHGAFAAEYTLTQGDPDSACGQLKGDVLGMQTYFQPGGPNGTPDYQNAMTAIRPMSLGVMIDYAETRGVVAVDEVYYQANAIGPFTDGFPSDEGFCMVNEYEVAQVSLPDIPALPDDPGSPDEDESMPAQPAVDVEYRWSDARFVVTADAQGTQFEAELEYRANDCTASYHVVGVYPVVECELDDDCNDVNNGINPDFAVHCNTELGLCVLDGPPPAYE